MLPVLRSGMKRIIPNWELTDYKGLIVLTDMLWGNHPRIMFHCIQSYENRGGCP